MPSEGAPGQIECTAMSINPPLRSTMVQEKMRTSPLLQNGSTISRKSASRQRPLTQLGQRERRRIADHDAPERDIEAQAQRAPGQRAIELFREEGGVVLQREFGFTSAEWGHGHEAEQQHGRERHEDRQQQPDIGGPEQIGRREICSRD